VCVCVGGGGGVKNRQVKACFQYFTGFCIIGQMVTLILPGKMPMMFSVCLGTIPKTEIDIPYKKNHLFFSVLLGSWLLHMILLLCFAFRRFKEKHIAKAHQVLSLQEFLKDKAQKESLFM
jgi:hypothetical protein